MNSCVAKFKKMAVLYVSHPPPPPYHYHYHHHHLADHRDGKIGVERYTTPSRAYIFLASSSHRSPLPSFTWKEKRKKPLSEKPLAVLCCSSFDSVLSQGKFCFPRHLRFPKNREAVGGVSILYCSLPSIVPCYGFIFQYYLDTKYPV